MKQIGLAIFFLAGLVFILPSSSGKVQKKKDPAEKAEKKTDENKDPAKKDDEKKDLKKKDDEKKDAKKDDDKKDPKKRRRQERPQKRRRQERPQKERSGRQEERNTKKASDKLVYAYKFTTKVMSRRRNLQSRLRSRNQGGRSRQGQGSPELAERSGHQPEPATFRCQQANRR